MALYERYLKLNQRLSSSIFFFGARQTGKSTILKKQFKSAIMFDLLDSELRMRLSLHPTLLYQRLKDEPEGSVVIIDEIQELPQLLNEVHRLISEKHLIFILCGSSARKLKRKGHNTLGGRAYPKYLFPLVSCEIPDFDLERALITGLLPEHYLAKEPYLRLKGYIDIYLKEEILQEALVRNLSGFERFLEVAALTNGEIVNYNNIASDCKISSSTVREYFGILQDTLIGYMIPSFTKTLKRRVVQAPKFYFFDVGVVNYLLGRQVLKRGSVEYGKAFEHLVIQEIIAWIGYVAPSKKLSYWHTYTGLEVDAVIDNEVAIEIKSADEILPKHLKGLKAFGEEWPNARKIVVSLDRFSRKIGDIECLYVKDFFNILWSRGL